MTKVFVKFFDNEENVVLIPVSSTDVASIAASGYKPAESYADAKKRNYSPQKPKRLLGSVLLSGRG